ncbi:pyridoxal-phosphate dependent enzyme [Agrobacterium sp. NPDC089420]|uniref:pyridoxal-phosphate dependent enzyme n=1 Tax=Agrobacterium sp. NPDC089420 TaxID=3363918 RepID=UPI00384A7FFC
MALHTNTPLLSSRPLSIASNKTIWLKFDALQPSGSFKIRGIGFACEHHLKCGKKRFVSSSGGNAGLAVAYAARCLGVPATVVVPTSTSERAKDLLVQEGAKVIVQGNVWSEANEHALTLVSEDAAFIHPFDDPLLWKGHSTLIDEVVRDNVDFDCVVLSVGGGGLLSGVVEGLRQNGRMDVPVVAVETRGTDSLAQSLIAGENTTLPAITSIASSLGASRVSDHAFRLARSYPVYSHVVSDWDAVNACKRFLNDHRVLVEPACGASLALAYNAQRSRALQDFRAPLIIVCGGVTATADQINRWLEELAPQS